jgi:hypothetical protein
MLEFVRWDYHVVITYDPMRMRIINANVTTVNAIVGREMQL